MDTEQTTETDVDSNNEGEGQSQSDTITISKTEWEKTNQTLGSYKRELKDLKKASEKPKEETPTSNQKPDDALVQKLERMSLRQAGITDPEDIELAQKTAKKWNVDIDEVLSDDDFKVKLEKQQTARANALATSNIKGGSGTSQAKNSAEYWLAKGQPPTATDVPDRKARQKINREFLAKVTSGDGKKFYND